MLNVFTAKSNSTAYEKNVSPNTWTSQHFVDRWIALEFMLKSLAIITFQVYALATAVYKPHQCTLIKENAR